MSGGRLARVLAIPETLVVGGLRLRPKYPPLFVVGAPRSGTTVVIQHIINSYEFAYFPNLAKQHPLTPVMAAVMARLRFRYTPSYRSAYGIIDGPMSPSDGWDILHRWFPRYDYRVPVRRERLYEFRNIVRFYEVIFKAPFANKNNANSVRMDDLLVTFPNALFVFVTRDLTDTVASVLASRSRHGTPENEWWGVAPPQYWNHTFASETERAVYQTLGVTDCVESSLSGLPQQQYARVSYETFCDNPSGLLEWVAERYGDAGIELRPRAHADTAASFERKRADDGSRAALRDEVARIAVEYRGSDET